MTGGSASEQLAKALNFDPQRVNIRFGVDVKSIKKKTYPFDALVYDLVKQETSAVMFVSRSDFDKAKRVSTHKSHSDGIDATNCLVISDFELDENLIATYGVQSVIVSPETLERFRRESLSNIKGDFKSEALPYPVKRNMYNHRRRENTEIEYDIFRAIVQSEDAGITRIAQECNLNFRNARAKLFDMLDSGLIVQVLEVETGTRYELTQKGIDRYHLLEKLQT